MQNKFEDVKCTLGDLGYYVSSENVEDHILVVDNPEQGIHNLMIVIDSPLLIFEQFLVKIKHNTTEVYQELLKRNRDLVHGAFTLADDGETLLFRDTLQVDNLDANELEGSLNAITLMMTEHGDFLQTIAQTH